MHRLFSILYKPCDKISPLPELYVVTCFSVLLLGSSDASIDALYILQLPSSLYIFIQVPMIEELDPALSYCNLPSMIHVVPRSDLTQPLLK